MIRRKPSGAFYCDGRECGYELQRCAGDDEHHDEIVCLDCGSAMYVAPLPPPTTPTPKRERLNMGEKTPEVLAAYEAGMATANKLLSARHTFSADYIGMAVTQDALRAFDAARTEGRGEGEPVAWMQSRFIYDADGYRIGTDEPEFRVGSKCPDESDAGYDTWYPLYASPIREPEISRAKRDEIEKLLRENLSAACGLHCQREQTQAEEDDTYRKTADAILNLTPVGGWRPTHRHLKRGTDYQVIGHGWLQTASIIGTAADDENVTIYRGDDGRLWVRPTAEFNDGRFEPLPPQEQGGMK